MLGKEIPVLLKILTEQLPNTVYIREHFIRSQTETARVLIILFLFIYINYVFILIKALWDLMFLESNRTLLLKLNGVERLTNALKKLDNEIVKKNILGVLYMLETPSQPPPPDKRYII